MSIRLALADAAKNTREDAAVTTLFLKSGVSMAGQLDRPGHAAHTALIKQGGGWTTVLIEEIAAVSSQPAQRF